MVELTLRINNDEMFVTKPAMEKHKQNKEKGKQTNKQRNKTTKARIRVVFIM